MADFDLGERRVMTTLSTASRIQDFLNTLPFNHERSGETCRSPRRVLRDQTAHCLEGALLAAAAFEFHGQRPLLLDLKSARGDFDHVVALFRVDGCWGAVSKTNHAVLRYREPVYKSIRELAMSYFHEYFLNDGRKTLRSFSKSFCLRERAVGDWKTDEKDLWHISRVLDRSPHEQILTRGMITRLRRADRIEREAGRIVESEP